jgi:hypothetical protein
MKPVRYDWDMSSTELMALNRRQLLVLRYKSYNRWLSMGGHAWSQDARIERIHRAILQPVWRAKGMGRGYCCTKMERRMLSHDLNS